MRMLLTMFPHTVTLYLPRAETDPETLEDRITNHITVLQGVLLEKSGGTAASGSSLKDADSAVLYVPFDVRAADGLSGAEQIYVSPADFARAEGKSGLWTLPDSEDAFFLKGEAVFPERSIEELGKECGDVFRITRVAEWDIGNLRHWKVEGK